MHLSRGLAVVLAAAGMTVLAPHAASAAPPRETRWTPCTSLSLEINWVCRETFGGDWHATGRTDMTGCGVSQRIECAR
ncbi:hypothetical protein BTM25_14650 [Actinomadura rubteroloni]|uniref:Uncharacterized protein n=1 Tax=Actinomadura rubteroloni TaxID=1926885 RepID=A0A2P4UPS7_9ACTN|nr:hypothetical protein [Actinomadura rubteroloni]POM27057.1 hypothetical protein BTM25_14650 [Actinomadura rubteroloni]